MEISWTFKVFRTWEEVDSPDFVEQWHAWFSRSPDAHVFIHPVMIKTWTDVYRSLREISPLYCVARSGDLVVFMPLVSWRRNWKNVFVRWIVPAGYADYDYHDPLVAGVATEEQLIAFWDALLKKLRRGDLGSYDYLDVEGIRIPGDKRGWGKTEICPYTDLGRFPDFECMYSSLSKSLRKDIRKRKRLLEERGALTFHVFSRDELSGALEDLPVFLEEHGRRWPDSYKAPGFHESLLRNALPEGLLHYSRLRLDGRPISWEIGFRLRDRAYSYMPCYLDEYSGYSLGKIHLAYLLEDCYRDGIRYFDFMRGAEEYKADWSHDEAPLYHHAETGRGVRCFIRLKTRALLVGIRNHFSGSSIPVLILGNCPGIGVGQFFTDLMVPAGPSLFG